MSALWCSHCGSRNHQSYDCSDQWRSYQPTAEELAEAAPPSESVPPPSPEPEPTLEPGPSRFKGCPSVCTATNLPSFQDQKAIDAFLACNASTALDRWQCDKCGLWHYLGKPLGPSGSSSSTERQPYHAPPGWVPFQRPKLRPSAFAHATQDLPRREAAEPGKKLEAPKPRR